MNPLRQTTTYRVTCLTPVHLGTGARLNHFDGCYEGGRWWRIDLDKVLARGANARALAEAMKERDFRWLPWLRQQQYRASEVSSYSVSCPYDPNELPIREGAKDAYWQPYLPGSSLKGAVRTALLWWLLDQNDDSCEDFTDFLLDELDSSRPPESRWLAQSLERELLGVTPNHDLLRALQVTDSVPCAAEQLYLGETKTYSLFQQKFVPKREPREDFRNLVEWLRPQTKLQLKLSRDEFLLKPEIGTQLGFNDAQHQALKELAQVCNAFALKLLQREQQFYQEYQAPKLATQCEALQIECTGLAKGAFLLNLGWAGGWQSKTVGDLVRELLSDESFKRLRRRFELGKHPRKPIDRYLDMRFPHSRQLATVSDQATPLGWVKLEAL